MDVAKRSNGTGERFTVESEAVKTIPTRIKTKMDPTIKLIKLGMAKQAISGKGKRCWPSHHQGVRRDLKLSMLLSQILSNTRNFPSDEKNVKSKIVRQAQRQRDVFFL